MFEGLITPADLCALYSDTDIAQELRDREKYLQYLGKDYEKYISGIKQHNYKHGLIGGHRWDVCNFFQNMDDSKRNQLICFFEERNKDLFNVLFTVPTNEEQVENSFKEIIETNGEKIESITGIHKQDLQYLFRCKTDLLGRKDNQTIDKLISCCMDHHKKSNDKK